MIVYGLPLDGDSDKPLTSFVYLDGEVEKKNGYDLVSLDHNPHKDGIYPVTIILHNKTEIEGTMFFWYNEDNLQRGLIVENGDIEAMKNARKKYENKERII